MKISVLSATIALAFAGCASSKASEQPTTPESEPQPPVTAQQPDMRGSMGDHRGGMMSGGEAAGMCPMAVPGTTARAEEVEGGAAMVFTTTGDVSELRQRVAAMAEMHNRRQAEGSGRGMGMHGGGPGAQGAKEQGEMKHRGMGMHGGGMMMPPSTARSEEAPEGARLVFTPQNPADLPALREHFAQRAQMMNEGRCPMMSAPAGQPEQAPAGEASEHERHHPTSD